MIKIYSIGSQYDFDCDRPIDISIPMVFGGLQPNAYGVEPARSEPCKAGDFVGDTRQGGSVNFEQYTFIPHCNGTHTECVGHITRERISVRDCLKDIFVPAILISVNPIEGVSGTSEIITDQVITKQVVSAAVQGLSLPSSAAALVVRTLPNDKSKLDRQYGVEGETAIPPYFSAEAMQYIVELGINHLLVDMPSIDRIFDKGKLVNHRIFWNVEEGSLEVNQDTRVNSTITELIYVPAEVEDGEYLLNLQIAPFASDASPSRPLLLKARKQFI